MYNTHAPGGSGVDALVIGAVSHAAQNFDRFFTKQVTSRLFADNMPNSVGTDLPSLNIQRGRDHGLPSRFLRF